MLVNNVESEFTTHRRMEATDRTTLCPINPMVTAVQRIKVELAPHETRRVSIELDARRFSSWLSDRWEIPHGDHVIELGRSAGDVVEIGRLTI